MGPAQIEYIEHLGRESFAGILLKGAPFIIEVEPDAPYHPGDVVDISLSRRHVLFFDEESEVALPVDWNDRDY